jgi:hypothetical protein
MKILFPNRPVMIKGENTPKTPFPVCNQGVGTLSLLTGIIFYGLTRKSCTVAPNLNVSARIMGWGRCFRGEISV